MFVTIVKLLTQLTPNLIQNKCFFTLKHEADSWTVTKSYVSSYNNC